MEELVSVITPMYNAQEYIEQTIQSVQAQTYTNWEMLIVDDCSVDQSVELVQKYATQDNRIILVKKKENSGVAQSRNLGIQKARGRYIAFLDSDDIWEPEKLFKQLEQMKRQNNTISYAACYVIDENGKKTGKIRHVPEKVTYRELLKGNVMPCLTVLVDRKDVEKMQMQDVPHEDYAMWLEFLRQGMTAAGIDEPLASYRQRNESVSGNKWKAMLWTWEIYRKQQKLSLPYSIYCFICYLGQAVKKYV